MDVKEVDNAGGAVTTTIGGVAEAHGLPRSEAFALLAHATGWSRERLIAGIGEPSSEALQRFDDLAKRRRDGEPIAYLIGQREFYGRRFAIDHDVLIPRPETEGLVDVALAWLEREQPHRIVDLGTGSGAIAITLALELPALSVVATDASHAALAIAHANADRLGAAVRFELGDWYGAVSERFDCIVSNPPYIAASDRHLALGDLRFEPRRALTDDADGLSHLRTIVADAPMHLLPGGALIVEHGHDQGATVRALYARAGFVRVASHTDLAGIERVTFGVLPDQRGTTAL